MKILPILVAVLITALASAQSVVKPITYTSRARPLKEVLAKLSSETGLHLTAADDMIFEPLILDVEEVSAQEVMDKIAIVFQAKWVPTKDGQRLARSKEDISALQKQISDERTTDTRAAIKALVDLQKQNGQLTPESALAIAKSFSSQERNEETGRVILPWKDQFYRSNQMPITRLAIKVLSRFDPEELADVEFQRAVYSNDPLPLQQLLPKFDPHLIQDYLSERAILAAAFKQIPEEARQGNGWELEGATRDLPEPPTKLLVSFMRYGSTLTANVKLLDSHIRQVDYTNVQLDGPYFESLDKTATRAELRAEAMRSGFALGPVGSELATRRRRAAHIARTRRSGCD